MGQQQLLLLVLSTVIVGLATVAGIQAFSENQQQATQDALVQRGTTIMSDVKGLAGKPPQLGGIDLSTASSYGSDVANILDRLGYDDGDTGDAHVPVDGAGGSAECKLGVSSGTAGVVCTSNDSPQDVKVTLNSSSSGEISTEFGSSLSVPGG
ncbi:hypothetical protein GGP85_002846 [Salinibacter ruber]|jgi:hypothetical protein|uniref:hypothetical protein n=1 Tax=Salinibacter ruber TaxID=146919 RepID=UPI00216A2E56|nr:hypothetical protein [Salinibacter ruber]MCS3628900.1 hypothetical protein [Salinibacter ruber]MCS3667107.1 hypothetical protein [Salinibacter ruber]MCS3697591.1 hypothetical protein [Salinibacter ruber]MCS3827377.1 hypothetical protein [Salinibacter ruber]MCS4145809.1 hypothetical protein [Salinibacter ruber]